MKRQNLLLALSLAILFASSFTNLNAQIQSTTGGGAWNDTLTWDGWRIPGAVDDVVIIGPVDVTGAECKNLMEKILDVVFTIILNVFYHEEIAKRVRKEVLYVDHKLNKLGLKLNLPMLLKIWQIKYLRKQHKIDMRYTLYKSCSVFCGGSWGSKDSHVQK